MNICCHMKLSLMMILLFVLIIGESRLDGSDIIEEEYSRATHISILGEWTTKVGSTGILFKVAGDGTFELRDAKGHYFLEGNKLILDADGSRSTYDFELAEKELTLSGGGLVKPLKFTKVPGSGEFQTWYSRLSKISIVPKIRRIAVVVAIAVLCRVVLLLLRSIIRFVIYTDRSLLKHVYRNHKNRTMTMYSLVLNLSKYVVYFTAIGLILTELGINYTAYLASLSVIGLAIGFGSQGLVQDMVTGFFIVFEEQFNVGDMVEIPPHVGVVEELGLRMTKLRNYLGQRVVIPNRNIATVGTYFQGTQHVYIDVAVMDDQAKTAEQVLTKLASQISVQFSEIIISARDSLDLITLTTGESFFRLHLSIWPQQQWVIEQELTPRIREALKRDGVDIPGDKIIVFYHPRERRSVRAKQSAEPASKMNS